MKKNIFVLLTAVFAFNITSCKNEMTDKKNVEIAKPDVETVKPDVEKAKPIELTLKQAEKVSLENRFSFEIFREVSTLSNKPNTFFSPLSLHFALGMLYNGASGETRTEMAEVLGMANFTDMEINEYYKKMSEALLNIDPKTEMSIANSIWCRNGFPVKQPFIEINKKYFDASVQTLDFNKPEAADIINKWCSDKTKKRIPEIIQNPIGSDIQMYLINALYFKSKWRSDTKFDKKNTIKDNFTKADMSVTRVNMMEQTNTFPYYADDNLQCVELPYGNRAFGMVVLLGDNGMSIDRLIDNLDDANWQHIIDNMYDQKVWLKLPRFKIECDMQLKKPVINVGMQRIFQGGFANISDVGMSVSDIKQKTFVEVNEEGTEAAAVTAGMTGSSLDPNKPVPFFADRPFLYLIRERSTGAILFIGRMDEPRE